MVTATAPKRTSRVLLMAIRATRQSVSSETKLNDELMWPRAHCTAAGRRGAPQRPRPRRRCFPAARKARCRSQLSIYFNKCIVVSGSGGVSLGRWCSRLHHALRCTRRHAISSGALVRGAISRCTDLYVKILYALGNVKSLQATPM